MEIVVADNFNDCVEAQYVEMMVPLYCYGCERKIKKALSHLKGVYSVNVDFKQQKVTVWGTCNKFDVLSKVKRKRKGARFWINCEDCPKQEDNNAEVCQDDRGSPSALSHSQRQPHSNRGAVWRSWSYSQSVNHSVNLFMNRSLSLKLSVKKFFTRPHSF